MGTSSVASLRRAETIFDPMYNTLPTIYRGSSIALCINFVVYYKCCSGSGEGGRRNQKQMLVYFVSKVLSPSNRNYTEMEKVLYAVLIASRKLQHYFHPYNIIVPSSQRLKDIIRNREATRQIGK
jgi:hypothetical protein